MPDAIPAVKDADPDLMDKLAVSIGAKHSTVKQGLTTRLDNIRANPKDRQADLLDLEHDVMAAADHGQIVP